MGAKMPPPRAVLEGTTGPSNNSAPQIEYPKPKGDFAKRLTNRPQVDRSFALARGLFSTYV